MPVKTIGQEFMRETQYQNMGPSSQSQGLPQPPLELPYDVTQRPVDLPAPADLAPEPVDLRALIEQRSTIRNYARTPLSLPELSYLLWCTQGVKSIHESLATSRTVPSAGARHAFETYLLANNVEGLDLGVYRFLASTHRLLRLELGDSPDITARLTRACLNQEQVARSAATFFWVAVVERMAWRYGERSYRYLHLDAGHVCQNLYLAAQGIGCGVCAMAAYDDVILNAVLELDGENEFVIYMATVGKRA